MSAREVLKSVLLKAGLSVNVSVSVAVLFPGVGSVTPGGVVTFAVLTRLPVAAATTVPVSVKVALAPLARLMPTLMLPLPAAGPAAPLP